MTNLKKNPSFLTFGDLFSYQGNNFIYLITDDKADIHAGKIISIEEVKKLDDMFLRTIRSSDPKRDYSLCYVVLKTPELKDHGAVFPFNYTFSELIPKLSPCLDITDLKKIKKEILNSKAVPENIKEKIKSIKL